MGVRDEFEEGLRKYAKLNALWCTAAVLAVAAYFSVPLSFTLGAVFFFLGGIMLGAAGATSAYTIASENL